jgi:hypothetical protein
MAVTNLLSDAMKSFKAGNLGTLNISKGKNIGIGRSNWLPWLCKNVAVVLACCIVAR